MAYDAPVPPQLLGFGLGARPRAAQLACLFFPLIASLSYWVAQMPLGTRGRGYVAVHLCLAALMLTAWALGDGVKPGWALAAGVAARLSLLPAPPFTTHDVARYLWDGRAALVGLDPYRVSPDAAQAAALAAAWPVAPEHAAFVTLYPPGAIALFAGSAAFGTALAFWAWKVLVTAASVGTVVLAAAALRERNAARHLPLVALSPLLVLESGVGAHLDALTALAAAAAILLAGRRRALAAGCALGVGALIKFVPLLLVLPLAAGAGRRFTARLAGGAAAVVASGYLVALALGLRPLGSLGLYFQKWRFGSPGFAALEAAAGAEHAVSLAALAAAALALVAALAFSRRLDAAIGAPLLASPVVFPWYLSTLVPALAVAPSATWLSWTLTAPLTYEVLDRFEAGGGWAPGAWPLWLVAVGLVLGLAIDAWLVRPRSAPAATCALPPA